MADQPASEYLSSQSIFFASAACATAITNMSPHAARSAHPTTDLLACIVTPPDPLLFA